MSMRAFLIAVLLAFSCSVALPMKAGDTVPAFTRADLAGKPLRFADFRGKLVLLNFWATWCAPCREEIPIFSSWQKTYGAKGLRVIGISMDDDVASVREFLREYPAAYPIAMGDAAFAEVLGGVLGLPLSYLVDAKGRVIARYQGAIDLPQLEAGIKTRLASQ
jgi:thiol-disulfide isomerase/thioredoxin